ncbi:hypothetical protein MCOR27_002478 [Pyricularia oryzae]|uniref:2-dehydropantoate 2-reductase n=2 Tax=Pyricularia TaxID=48558 RepID=A0ABQ8N2V9_PYRGI|nr:hypothetical protein MCOR01_007067 [Pyricularia oryzae]KAI6290196.1 hypothetical protein MCOR33_011446 [Pyricularia grisea]KAH9434357.1 hypothetical protein MCOR02_006369 [Pyricularia oryzae]KAI6257006.1 hypothetical protein MCOR19_006585 [Pyricularia oryzae]KAI6277728.1 hypothetical protein MCOR26_005014 [Pyricularia oryzae]
MASNRPVNIVFVGAGAVGCFYASRLHHPKENVNVSLIARSNYPVLVRSGVRMLTHSFGDYTFVPAAVYSSVSAASPTAADQSSSAGAQPPKEGWDYVIVTTKALPDRVDDAATIAPLVTPGKTCIVLIQNGVGVEAPYRSRFPSNPIVSAVTVVSAELVDPGTVRQNRWTRLYLGPYVNSASYSDDAEGKSGSSQITTEMGRKLEDAGSACVMALTDWWTRLGSIKDVESHAGDELGLQTVRWHKLVINAAFNPSSVLSGGRNNAHMATDPELRRHLRGIMYEIFAAAPRVLGRPFPPDLAAPEKILASNERNKGSKGPSMLLDWQAGRPLELEVIVGNPVRIARAKGVEMPRLQSVYALLKSMQDARDQAKASGQDRGKL